MKNRAKRIAAAMPLALLGAANTAGADLIHRYNFNTNFNDSVGTAHATPIHGASLNGTGQVVLANGGFGPPSGSPTAQYVELGTGSNVLPTSGSVTIEQWFTFTGSGFFTEAYAFTNADDVTNPPTATNGQYLMHNISFPADLNIDGGSRITQTVAGFTAETSAFALPGRADAGFLDNGATYMCTTVIDSVAGTLSYYIDGVPQDVNVPNPITLSAMSVTKAWLGRSPFAVDFATTGVIDEFRLYAEARTAAQIAADFAAGPNVIPEPTTLGIVAAGAFALLRRMKRVSRAA